MSERRVLIFAPNGGASLSTGGGVAFIFRVARKLVSKFNCEVFLAGFHSMPEPILLKTYGDILGNSAKKVRIVPGILSQNLFSGISRFPFKFSAYNATLFKSFQKWVTKTIEQVKPDLIFFNDDIPMGASKYLYNTQSVLYVHFPLGARTPRIVPPMKRERPLFEAFNESLLLATLNSIVIRNPEESVSHVSVNSSVTADACRLLGRKGSLDIFYPTWVDDPIFFDTKELFSSIGTIHKEKRHETLIEAVSLIKNPTKRPLVTIAGFAREKAYLGKLQRMIRKRSLEGNVKIETNTSGIRLQEIMQRSIATIQLGLFEPFGMAPLESMRFGSIGVSRKSSYSGVWRDILEEGKHGLGFEDPEELSRMLVNLSHMESRSEMSMKSFERTRFFSSQLFEDNLRRMIPFET